MKMSEITVADVAEYLRLDEYNEKLIQTILDTAKSFVLDYTSLLADEAGPRRCSTSAYPPASGCP